MLILAIDGALARCSAALWADGTLLAHAAMPGERGHPAVLPPLVARVLGAAGVAVAHLDAIAAGIGPGGFTGLRAALSLAQGLALAGDVALIGITTGEAMAASLPPALRSRAVWSAIDNRRGRLVLERLSPGSLRATPPESLSEADLPRPEGPVVVVGDAAPVVAARLAARGADVLLADPRLPDAGALAAAAAGQLAAGLAPRPALPLYVEPPALRAPPR